MADEVLGKIFFSILWQFFCYWVNFHICKCPNIELNIWSHNLGLCSYWHSIYELESCDDHLKMIS